MIIEKMKIEDLDQIMIIEEQSFKIPWKRSFFEYDLKRPGGLCYIVKENDIILGYADAWHIADEIHLANIAVSLQNRHQGIGSRLLREIINIAEKNNCKSILLEVRLTNKTAQNFYKKFGFYSIFVRKKYYPDGEDAIVYKKRM